MKKSKRIKNKQEFDKFIKTTKYIKNSFFVLHFSKKVQLENRFGIAVGTSLGNAVTRNLLKRRTKEIIKDSQNLFQKDLDYIIIVRKSCVGLSYQEMKESLINLIKIGMQK
ncbi:MAG: ribonuclease P protein component [Bacilli bacterium]|nr:ribonuclease P protein component [Bacilli bacterium]